MFYALLLKLNIHISHPSKLGSIFFRVDENEASLQEGRYLYVLCKGDLLETGAIESTFAYTRNQKGICVVH